MVDIGDLLQYFVCRYAQVGIVAGAYAVVHESGPESAGRTASATSRRLTTLSSLSDPREKPHPGKQLFPITRGKIRAAWTWFIYP